MAEAGAGEDDKASTIKSVIKCEPRGKGGRVRVVWVYVGIVEDGIEDILGEEGGGKGRGGERGRGREGKEREREMVFFLVGMVFRL